MSKNLTQELKNLKSRRINELFDGEGETLNRLLKRVGRLRKIRDVSFVPDIITSYSNQFGDIYSRLFIPTYMVGQVINSKSFIERNNNYYLRFLKEQFPIRTEFYPRIPFSVFVIASSKNVFSNEDRNGTIKTFNVQYIIDNILCNDTKSKK